MKKIISLGLSIIVSISFIGCGRFDKIEESNNTKIEENTDVNKKRLEEEQKRVEEEQKRLEEEQKRAEEEQKKQEEEQKRLEEEKKKQEEKEKEEKKKQEQEEKLNSDKNINSLNNEKKSWYYIPNKEHKVPRAAETKEFLSKYNSYYIGDTEEKVIYLTFDEGVSESYAEQNLRTLRKHGIKSTFFVTRDFLKNRPDLVKAILNDGHTIGNHTANHPSMPTLADNKDKFQKEIIYIEDLYKKTTGQNITKFFRYPMGHYSEKSLGIIKSMGYKSFFWSFAHADYDIDNQPSVEVTKKKMVDSAHNGAIYLLHGLSKSDADALDYFITTLKKQGYSFKNVSEI
ncbi:polysaccharide deacetylase family protein [Hathewaya massiliensis]|uniref:polysaccharide deacetylase family protein n=1 Tax=Hathewaya massiliensis TaxID=1964382 RepID=UPI00115761CC|nr:polysaccharide deacetylase family protein [Hathewaya massiliensis]